MRILFPIILLYSFSIYSETISDTNKNYIPFESVGVLKFLDNNFYYANKDGLYHENTIENLDDFVFDKPELYHKEQYIDKSVIFNANKYVFWNELVFVSDKVPESFDFKVISKNEFSKNSINKKYSHLIDKSEDILKEVSSIEGPILEKSNEYFLFGEDYVPVYSDDDNANVIQYKVNLKYSDSFYIMSYPKSLNMQKLNIRIEINGEQFTFYDSDFSRIKLDIIDDQQYFLFSYNNIINSLDLMKNGSSDLDLRITELIYFFDKKEDIEFKNAQKNSKFSIYSYDNFSNYYSFEGLFEFFNFNFNKKNFMVFKNFEPIYSLEILNDGYSILDNSNSDFDVPEIIKISDFVDDYGDFIKFKEPIKIEDLRSFLLNNYSSNDTIFILFDDSEHIPEINKDSFNKKIYILILKIFTYASGTLLVIFLYIFMTFLFGHFFINVVNLFKKFKLLKANNFLWLLIIVKTNLTLFLILAYVYKFGPIPSIISNIIFSFYFFLFIYFTGCYLKNKKTIKQN